MLIQLIGLWSSEGGEVRMWEGKGCVKEWRSVTNVDG